MDANSGSALGELFASLRPESCGEVKAGLVAGVADRIAERQVMEERRGGKGIFSFSTREAALLELAPASGEVTAKTAQFVVQQLANAPKPWKTELDSWLAEKAPRWRLCSGVKIQNLMQAQYVKFDSDGGTSRK